MFTSSKVSLSNERTDMIGLLLNYNYFLFVNILLIYFFLSKLQNK